MWRNIIFDRLYRFHPEYKVLGVKESVVHLIDEIKEFIDEPSMDEFSDICYGVNRFLGSLFGIKYINLLSAKIHITKCNKRYLEYGHFRSKRHIG